MESESTPYIVATKRHRNGILFELDKSDDVQQQSRWTILTGVKRWDAFPCISNIDVVQKCGVFSSTELNQSDEVRRLLMGKFGLRVMCQLCNLEVKLTFKQEPKLLPQLVRAAKIEQIIVALLSNQCGAHLKIFILNVPCVQRHHIMHLRHPGCNHGHMSINSGLFIR